MSQVLNDDDIVELLNVSVFDIDRFNEGKEINNENLDEILSEFPCDVEVNFNKLYNFILL